MFTWLTCYQLKIHFLFSLNQVYRLCEPYQSLWIRLVPIWSLLFPSSSQPCFWPQSDKEYVWISEFLYKHDDHTKILKFKHIPNHSVTSNQSMISYFTWFTCFDVFFYSYWILFIDFMKLWSHPFLVPQPFTGFWFSGHRVIGNIDWLIGHDLLVSNYSFFIHIESCL